MARKTEEFSRPPGGLAAARGDRKTRRSWLGSRDRLRVGGPALGEAGAASPLTAAQQPAGPLRGAISGITRALQQTGKLWSLGPIGRVSAPNWPQGRKNPPYDAPFPAHFRLSRNLPQFVSTHPDLFFMPPDGRTP